MILTSDAATILRELEVVHPAAKLMVMASQQQEAEMGDATNLVIVLAGELLRKAEDLLRMGLKTSDIVQGYEKAQTFALECLEGMIKIMDMLTVDLLTLHLQSSKSIESKIFARTKKSPKRSEQLWHRSNQAQKTFSPRSLPKPSSPSSQRIP